MPANLSRSFIAKLVFATGLSTFVACLSFYLIFILFVTWSEPNTNGIKSNNLRVVDHQSAIPDADLEELEALVKAEQQKIAAREKKISSARNFLAARNSPMTNYAHVIVDAADRCGGNYKTLLAIAEIESGSGRLPYKKYNPYGYLNGVQYSGWASALDQLSCKISQQYIRVYGTDFVAMGKIYAGSTSWAGKISKVYNSIK